jgi:hypothetical protein
VDENVRDLSIGPWECAVSLCERAHLLVVGLNEDDLMNYFVDAMNYYLKDDQMMVCHLKKC